MGIRIEHDPLVVLGFLDALRVAADQEREALGFVRAAAYEQAARKGAITIAIDDSDDGLKYVGHVWVGGTYPHARVFQLYVLPAFRKKQIASRLLRAAIEAAAAQRYMSIKAHVAEDLAGPNALYGHHGFEHVSSKPGGATRNRKILVRVRELETPTLFNYRPARTLAVGGEAAAGQSSDQGLYLLDLNVFFDATRKRAYSVSAEKIIAASFAGDIRVGVTSEFVRELERTSASKEDPVLAFARKLPTVSGASRSEVATLAASLGSSVFPNQTRDGSISLHDQSDLRHLAEAILCGASGFITGEKAILRAHGHLRQVHRLEVWGTEEFADLLAPTTSHSAAVVHAEHDLSFRDTDLDGEAEKFLKQNGVASNDVRAFLARDALDKRFSYTAARESGALIAFAAYQHAAGPEDSARLLVVAMERHPSAPTATDYLLEHYVRRAVSNRPTRIRLVDVRGQALTRRHAMSNGFVRTASCTTNDLEKLALGGVLTASNWAKSQEQAERLLNISLPTAPPTFLHDGQAVPVRSGGAWDEVSLFDLESFLGPGLLLLPGRPVAVVPIRHRWASDLVGGAQLSLLPKKEAALRSRRVYFAHPVNADVLVRGRPIILYESSKGKGIKAAIAVARIERAEVIEKASAPSDLIRAAVVRGTQLADLTKGATVLAVSFDNIMRFATPVSYARMQALGVNDKTNIVRSRLITSDVADKIISAGRPHAE